MPVSNDDSVWQDGEEVKSRRQEILAFLRENTDKAFTGREISDQVMDTSWDLAHKKEREIQRIGEDEFWDRVGRGEYDEDFDSSWAETIIKSGKMTRLCTHLDTLIEEEKVEARQLPHEATDIPYEDLGDVTHYTYSG